MSISHLISAAVLVLVSAVAAAPLPLPSNLGGDERVVLADTCVVVIATVDGTPILVRVCQPDLPPPPPM